MDGENRRDDRQQRRPDTREHKPRTGTTAHLSIPRSRLMKVQIVNALAPAHHNTATAVTTGEETARPTAVQCAAVEEEVHVAEAAAAEEDQAHHTNTTSETSNAALQTIEAATSLPSPHATTTTTHHQNLHQLPHPKSTSPRWKAKTRTPRLRESRRRYRV